MLWYFFRLTELGGDIESNPGSKPDPSQSFSICHWSLKSISAHKYSKISLLIDILLRQIDIICLIYKHIYINDGNLKIPGYIMYRVHHYSNVKKGGVCIYYKAMLPLKV